ncbi:MAG: putative ABC transporter permease [Lachnospirales bacterium]|mgnify:CR=1 FL=1
MGFNFYVLSWMFLIYSFLGWCAEVIFVAFDTKCFDNRGFLRGPVCPIYGVGITLILFCLRPFTENWFVLFIISLLLTTVLELVVGILLKKCFHHEWWNYSQFRFNFRGYICLRFSLLWGVGCLFVVKFVHPVVSFFILNCPRDLGLPLLCFFGVIFIVDVVVTLLSIHSYPKRLKALNDIESRLHQLSEDLGISLFGSVSSVMCVLDKKNWAPDKQAKAREAEVLVQKREPLLQNKNHVHKHLLKGFSFLYEDRYRSAIVALKRYLMRNRFS